MLLRNAKLIHRYANGLRKQGRRTFFVDFGKWHIEKVLEKVFKYTRYYLNTRL